MIYSYEEMRKTMFLAVVFLLFINLSIQSKATIVLKKGTAIAKQIATANTRYEIIEDFELEGGTLTIPANCELDFRGGKISNGTVVFNQTQIVNPSFSKMHFQGSTPEDYFNISDFGAQPGDKTEDCSELINELIALKQTQNSKRNAKTIHIPNGTFYLRTPICLWAGWESPVTLEGNGNTSTLCQLTDNEYILKIYESHYVKNLRLTYDRRQGLMNSKAVAIACQRAIFCLFENLTICKAYNAVGYIKKADYKKDAFTNLNEQCYVSCNFRNIRIYEFSNYAFDFQKEMNGGDSGSVYDNIYINCQDWLSSTSDNVSKGAIRGVNTTAVFTQLNIEGPNYSNPLVDLSEMSRLSIASLHIEWLQNVPSIIKASIQSVVKMDVIDMESCSFIPKGYSFFQVKDNAKIDVDILLVKESCKKKSVLSRAVICKRMSNTNCDVNVKYRIDAIKIIGTDNYNK